MLESTEVLGSDESVVRETSNVYDYRGRRISHMENEDETQYSYGDGVSVLETKGAKQVWTGKWQKLYFSQGLEAIEVSPEVAQFVDISANLMAANALSTEISTSEVKASINNSKVLVENVNKSNQSSPTILSSEIVGKTPSEIEQIALSKELISNGASLQGIGTYNDPITGKQRVLFPNLRNFMYT